MTLTLPTIHLNGTSKEQITEALCDAYSAINDALSKLKQTAPNGRDYYPQGSEALSNATNEHFSRMQRLTSVMQELEQIAEALG
jgi:hypothetical protein